MDRYSVRLTLVPCNSGQVLLSNPNSLFAFVTIPWIYMQEVPRQIIWKDNTQIFFFMDAPQYLRTKMV